MDAYRIFLSICFICSVHARGKSVPAEKSVSDRVQPSDRGLVSRQSGTCPANFNQYAPQTISVVNYQNLLMCSWTINAYSGRTVKVDIGSYHIENGYNCVYDRLTVYTGSHEHQLCGEGSYQGYSAGSQMSLVFQSDISVSDEGFVAQFVQLSADERPPIYSMDTVGPTVTFSQGQSEVILQSHTTGSRYSNNKDNTVTIIPTNNLYLSLRVSYFSLEASFGCRYDKATVSDCAGNSLAVWCGSSGIAGNEVSADCLVVTFLTDGSVTSSGFVFSITTFEPSGVSNYQTASYYNQACSSGSAMSVDVTSGPMEIASPYFGMLAYTNNLHCRWIVTATRYVKVVFSHFAVENQQNCGYDVLVFYDGSGTDSPVITAQCGHDIPPVFTSTGSTMLIVFSSDYTVTDEGFLLTVSNVDNVIGPEDACSPSFSPVHVTTSGVTLTSPEFGTGSNYPPNSHCTWLITAPQGQTVTLTFTSFHLEQVIGCYFDFVGLYEGTSENDPMLGGPYCGQSYPAALESDVEEVLLVFHSDFSVQYSGFSATVTFTSPPASPPASPSAPPPAQPPTTHGLCGVPAVTPSMDRIVGGEPALPHSWPWQISLRYRYAANSYYHICGGSVLDHEWVITAAHCVVSDGVVEAASFFQVVAGEHDRTSTNGFEQYIDVAEVISAPTYLTIEYPDAALLRLVSPLEFNSAVSPICLPSGPIGDGHECVATGWGDTQGTGSMLVLNEVNVPVLSDAFCTQSYGYSINQYTVCAGYPEGGRDTCQGDSGGPLVCQVNGVYELHGLTSFGQGCALAGYPGVYARVTTIQAWIVENAQNNVHYPQPNTVFEE